MRNPTGDTWRSASRATATSGARSDHDPGRQADRLRSKRESFEPSRLKAGSVGETRWRAQLERLKGTCERGGYGFWVTDPAQTLNALCRIRDGWHVAWEGDYHADG